MQQKDKGQEPAEEELSEVWKALLNQVPATDTDVQAFSEETAIPTLESDPWNSLLQARGVETVDLQQLHLHMSDQDVEQALQFIQEQAKQQPE